MPAYERAYRIIRELGEGGMGKVYLAEHRGLERQVALKVLSKEHEKDESFMRRFRQEAKAAKELPKHLFVVGLLDYDLDGDPPYIVLEYIDGARPLLDILAEGKLTLQQGLSLAYKISKGMEHIHRHGMVHRDLKPANILVTPSWDIVIIDLGLARAVTSDETRATMAGGTVGTLSYMPPEQLGNSDVGPASDVYALGLIIIELAAGKLIWSATVADSADYIPAHKRLSGNVPPLQEIAPRIRGAYDRLATLVQNCIALEPKSRPRDCGAVSRQLLPLIDTEKATERPGQVGLGWGRRTRTSGAATARDATIKVAPPDAREPRPTPALRVASARGTTPVSLPTSFGVLALVLFSGTCGYLLRWPGPVPAVPLVTVGTTAPSARAPAVGSEEAARLREALGRVADEIDLAWLERFANQHKRIIKKVPETVSLAIKEHLTKIGILTPLEQFLPVARSYFGADAIPEGERWALRYRLCDLEIIEEFCAIHGVPLPWGDTSITRVFPVHDDPIDIPSLDLEHARTWVRASNTAASKWFPGASFEEMWTIPTPRPHERLLVWFSVARWKPGVLLDVRLDRRIRRIIRYAPPISDPPPLKIHALEYELFGKIQENATIKLTEALRFPRAYIGRWFPNYGVSGSTHLKISMVDLPLRGLGADDPSIVDRIITLANVKAVER